MSRAVWVTREQGFEENNYELWRGRPKMGQDGEWDGTGWVDSYCASDFERITGFRLKPGEGPVKVKIEVKRVK